MYRGGYVQRSSQATQVTVSKPTNSQWRACHCFIPWSRTSFGGRVSTLAHVFAWPRGILTTLTRRHTLNGEYNCWFLPQYPFTVIYGRRDFGLLVYAIIPASRALNFRREMHYECNLP